MLFFSCINKISSYYLRPASGREHKPAANWKKRYENPIHYYLHIRSKEDIPFQNDTQVEIGILSYAKKMNYDVIQAATQPGIPSYDRDSDQPAHLNKSLCFGAQKADLRARFL